MLRTLHLNTEPTWRGGEAQTLYLVRGLKRRGHVADLVCLKGAPLAERAAQEGITVIPMRFHGEIDLLAALRLRRHLKRGAYDIIHAHTSHAHTLAVMAAWRLDTRVVISRRVDFSIFRHSFLRLNALKYRYGFDIILTVSDAIRNVLIRDGVPARLIRTVHSGIDPQRFAPDTYHAPFPQDIPIPKEALLVVNTAHLTPHKGQIHLVRAFPEVVKRTPRAFLLIVGQGALHDQLGGEIDRLGLRQHALLTGFRSDIGAILANTTVYAMPSVEEGLGTAVLDAYLFSCPVVASRAGGIPEMVRDGVNGRLVEPADPAALADAISELLNDPPLRTRLGSAARRTVLEEFTADRTVEKTIRAYDELLHARSGT